MLSRSTRKQNANSRPPESGKRQETSTDAGAAGPGPKEVHIWRARLDLARCDLDFITHYLSHDEWSKAQQFRFGLHQDRYAAGRAILRTLLGRYLGCCPGGIEIRTSEWGKPRAAGCNLQFNVSHSEEVLLMAVSQQPVGVDIELIRPLEELEMLVRTVFSREELEMWRGMPQEARQDAFFRLWTRKEALLKGIGLGIPEHTQEVSVFFDSESEVKIPPALTSENWIVRNLNRSQWHSAAVATTISEPIFIEREFTTEHWL